MVPYIREIGEKICDIWMIRLAVLFSLFFQTLLILLSPSRKCSSNKILALTLWSCYLLADITATYAVGLISHDQQCRDSSDDDLNLLAFWSPFLIIHLGGPDTITALALEDNELWLRHLLTLVFQAAATLYVFWQSLPENKLIIPMILMFLSGCIKYLERIISLYLASGDRIPRARRNNSRFLNIYLDYDSKIKSSSGQVDELKLVRAAYRCKIINLIPSPKESIDDPMLLRNIRATTVLRLLEVELNFLYDILFTKTRVVHTSLGFFFRFFSFCCLIASLAVFHFHITKHGVFNGTNVVVTYVLFLGAVVLELIAFLMAVLSDWTVDAMIESEESSKQNWWRKGVSNFVHPAFCKIWSCWTPRWYLEESAQPKDQELRTPLLSWRWSGCLSGHNLIKYCLKGRHSGTSIVKAMDWVIERVGLRDFWDEMSCLSREPLRKNLWILIFQQLKDKSRSVLLNRVTFLEKSDLDENLRKNLKEYFEVPSYDESLVVWHVATELMYNDKEDPANIFSENKKIRVGTKLDVDPEGHVEMSKTLSDYMMYLLIMRPDIMAPVGGAIGKTRFQDICAAAKEFFVRMNLGPSQQVDACNYMLEAKTRGELEPAVSEFYSVLLEARRLAKELRKLEDKKWEFISQVWVELLCYSASHCSLKAHAQQLRKGGELITFVWLLMQHFALWYSLDRQ